MVKRCKLLLAAAAITLGLTATFVAPRPLVASASTTHTGQLNGATVFGGGPHVFSYDGTAMNLHHSWWDGTQWRFEILDGKGCTYSGCFTSDDVGGAGFELSTGTDAIAYAGQLHVFTFDKTKDDLVHDWWDGSIWHFEQLDGSNSIYTNANKNGSAGWFTSAVIYMGQLHVFTYVHEVFGYLAHDWWDGTQWHFEVLDGNNSPYTGHSTDSVGFNVAALAYGSQLQVFYADLVSGYSSTTLHHAWWNGTQWQFSCLDGHEAGCVLDTTGADSVGYFNAAVAYSTQLQVFTWDQANSNLVHAWWDGAHWHSEYLDGPNSTHTGHNTNTVGLYNVAVVYGAQLQAWTYDSARGNLEHDWWNGSNWQFEKLAGADKATAASGTDQIGEFNTAVLFNGAPQVWSEDVNTGGLFHAWWTGAAWKFEEL